MKTTDELTSVLKKARPEDIGSFLAENKAKMLSGYNLFGDYLRSKAAEKGMLLQDVFIAADIPERYGYKLLEGEKHTRNRDAVIRLCAGARLSLDETQKALGLNGMAQLYSRDVRDAVIMIAINTGAKDASAVSEALEKHGQAPLAQIG